MCGNFLLTLCWEQEVHCLSHGRWLLPKHIKFIQKKKSSQLEMDQLQESHEFLRLMFAPVLNKKNKTKEQKQGLPCDQPSPQEHDSHLLF